MSERSSVGAGILSLGVKRMYEKDALVVYGGTGVCRVADITSLSMKGADGKRKYYVLKPLYQDGTIYAPVEGKVFMRDVISRAEADRLIDMIPTIRAEAHHDRNFNQLAAYYQQVMGSHDCADLIELAMSIYAKKQYMESQNKKFGQVDARFMRRAEGLLYGELAVALELPPEQVQDYISRRVEAARGTESKKAGDKW